LDSVVQLYVRLPTAETQTPDMVRALSRVMVSAQIDRGCDHVELTRDADDASVLIYVEDWEDREQLDRRIRSERFGALLGLMEACSSVPQLELRFVSEVQGLDYVASVRQTQ
jgi:quinol monooxygenase YgiN